MTKTETKVGFFSQDEQDRQQASEALQGPLVDLINASLVMKQAHWNLRGHRFQSVHEKLDDVIEDSRLGADECAERMATLGFAPDGRPGTIAEQRRADDFPAGFLKVDPALKAVLKTLQVAISSLRTAQATLADVDPISEDLVIAIAREAPMDARVTARRLIDENANQPNESRAAETRPVVVPLGPQLRPRRTWMGPGLHRVRAWSGSWRRWSRPRRSPMCGTCPGFDPRPG